ncbi:MAG TPA: photosynthetic reaction center cytochrome c subunit family protein [Vicinamibacterales bacterium]|nr:photosynthetic reaction center cytochrome c subunit family protein [Vicinamibacterales bacterium]
MSRRQLAGGSTIALAMTCWLGASVYAQGQAQAPASVPTSDQVFKNIQVLKGIPVDQFMDAMGMFSSSLGYDCSSCHSQEIHTDRAAFAIATPLINRARQMIAMMNAINETNFGGRPRVTCYTCHRTSPTPDDVPSLAAQYADVVDDPNSMNLVRSRTVMPDQVFAKYMQALGGAQKVAALTSFTARGTYGGFNTGGADLPIEINAKAPNQRMQIVRAPDAENVKVFNGQKAWVAEGWRPLPLMELTAGNLEGARIEALTLFPASIKDSFTGWQVGTGTIDDKPVQVLQGRSAGMPVNFYFDDAGLLVRTVRWNRTPVGTVPTQTDFSDYRDVAGVKMPFKTIITWTDGQNTIALNQVQANVAMDASKFATPKAFVRK